MKHWGIPVLSFVVIGVAALLAGGCSQCSPSADSDNNAQQAAAEARTADSPSYRWTVGEPQAYRFRLSQKMDMPEGLGNDQVFMLRAILNFAPIEKSADGSTALKASLHHVTATLSTGEKRQKLEIFRELEKAAWRIEQTPAGQITAITQIGEVTRNMTAMAQSLPRTLREMLPMLPPDLGKDKRWEFESSLAEPIPGFGDARSTTQTAYTYAGREKINGHDAARFDVTFAMDTSGSQAGEESIDPKPGPGIDAKQRMVQTSRHILSKGEGAGRIWFDENSGRFLGAEYETQVHINKGGTRERFELQNAQTIISRISVRPSFGADDAKGENPPKSSDTPKAPNAPQE